MYGKYSYKLRMTTSLQDLKDAHERACRYPHTEPHMFEQAALIRIGEGEVIRDENAHRAHITTSLYAHTLQGSYKTLPTYNVELPGNHILKDRIAILGIGSNCSPPVLIEKFRKAGVGGEVYLAQATLDHHAIVHSAFVGASAYMPTTIMPHEISQSHITVGFYTPDQAEALTATEPNYDLVQKSGIIRTRKLETNPILEHGALLYVSIWGAFAENGGNPVLQQAIPQISPLTAKPTIWTAAKAAEITGYGSDVLKLAENIKPGLEHLETRLRHTFKLHPHHALAAHIAGYPVKKASLYAQTKDLNIPPLPRISYL